ncbi:hypothetical protein, partial [Streptomyces sp. KR55]|uniref:hypothetical protein n=1 Tax=Streptomyces sp. KR55 TaxID=3457425 RepID=UPI003FD69417
SFAPFTVDAIASFRPVAAQVRRQRSAAAGRRRGGSQDGEAQAGTPDWSSPLTHRRGYHAGA